MAITFNHNDQVYVKDGKLGIGTANPNQKLEIRDTAPFLRITSTLNDDVNHGGREYGGIEWYTEEEYGNAPVVTAYVKAIHTRGGSNHTNADAGLVFGTSLISSDATATERMRIESMTGNVGIGTTSPDAKLSIDGGTDNLLATFKSTDDLGYISFQDSGTTSNTSVALGANDNNLVFFTGTSFGSERMRIDGSGNVGIGTTSPIQPLTVQAASNANTIALLGRSNDNNSRIDFLNSAGTSRIFTVLAYDSANQIYGDTNIPLTISTNATERMRITSAGIVLVNKTSSTGDIFQVQGNNNVYAARLDGSTTVGQSYGLRVRAGTNVFDKSFLIENAFGTDLVVVKGDGNLQLGAYGAGYLKSDADGNITVDSDTIEDTLQSVTDRGDTTTNNLTISNSSPDFFFETGATHYNWMLAAQENVDAGFEISVGSQDADSSDDTWSPLLIVKQSGNVGIGTTNPTTKLYVDAGESTFNRGNSDGAIARFRGKNNEKAVIGTVDSWFASNVGIGTTSPAQLLHIKGTNPVLNVETTWATGNYGQIRLGYTAGTERSITGHYDDGMTFDVNGERMRIDSSGNVGIGTISPTQKLEVDGTGKFDAIELVNGGGSTTRGLFSDGTQGEVTLISPERVTVLFDSNNNDANSFFAVKKDATDPSNATELFRVDSSGNVGIGTTSPATDLSLGNATHTSPDDTDRILNWYASTGGTEITNASHYITVGQNSSSTSQPKSVGLALFNPNTSNNTYSPAITFGGLSTSGDYMTGAGAISTQLIANADDNNFRGGDLTFYTSGTTSATRGLNEKMRITSRGNVGIGTTSPSQKLEVSGTIRGEVVNVYGSTNPASTSPYLFSPATGALGIGANGSERMRITSGGNVGIGTTNPDVKFQVQGGPVKAATSDYAAPSTGGAISMFQDSNDYGTIWSVKDYNGGWGNVAISPLGGNVGIGTTSPSDKLVVAGIIKSIGGTNDGKFAQIYVNDSYAYYTTNAGVIYMSTELQVNSGKIGSYDEDLSLETSGTTRITVSNTTGNVGIGTTSPSTKLQVADGGVISFYRSGNDRKGQLYTNSLGTVLESDSIGNDPLFLRSPGTSGMLLFFTSTSEKMRITSGGNVGIGTTSPVSTLTVLGTTTSAITIQSGSALSGLKLFNNSTTDEANIINHYNGPLILGTNNSERVRITGGGNVGIGTTSPPNKLTVYQGGGVRVTGIASGGYIEMSGDLPGYSANQYPVIKSGGTIHFANNNKYSAYIEGTNTYFGILDSTPTTKVLLHTSGNSYLNGGNVGIGTTSPTQKLDVNGDIAVKGASVINRASAALVIGDIAGTDSITNLTLTTAGRNTEVFLDDSGNVGINDTTPSYALDVTGTIRATGDVIAYSDARVKENVETIPNALDKVKAMRGVGYNKIGEEKRSIGVIAQEMLDVIPEVVHTDDQGMHSVAYGNLVGVLIEAMKEQQQQIEELKAIIDNK